MEHTTAVRTRRQTGWSFFDPRTIPWTAWAMPGTRFKLLNIDEDRGSFTFLLQVDAGIEAPVHKHVGLAEAWLLEGEFGYGDDRGSAGCYTRELGGAVHKPDSPRGVLMFAVAHGPIVGYNADGSVAGIVDVDWMYEAAAANGAAAHIRRHNTFFEEPG
jgi:anti-sigma factor ChrR (cupin superfamily)